MAISTYKLHTEFRSSLKVKLNLHNQIPDQLQNSIETTGFLVL